MRILRFWSNLDTNSKLTLSIIVFFALGILTYLSIFNLAGRFGSIIGQFLGLLLGRGSVILPASFFLAGIVLIKIQREPELREDAVNPRLAWGLGLLIICLTGFLSMIFDVRSPARLDEGGGLLGYIVYPYVLGFFGIFGAVIILMAIGLFGFFLITQMTFAQFLHTLSQIAQNPVQFWDLIPDVFEFWKKDSQSQQDASDGPIPQTTTESQTSQAANQPNHQNDVIDVQARPPLAKEDRSKKPRFSFSNADDQGVIDMERSEGANGWRYPPFDILKEEFSRVEPGDIENNQKIIQQTLAHFGIKVEMGMVRVGPTVTQYTLKPANGVKLAAIDNLQRDLALALAARNIRIEAPIAGQSLVGIEIPNTQKRQVRLVDVLRTPRFDKFSDDLPIAVGQDVAGNNVIYSLAKMPHLLVAGATGSGKSVWINGLLLSLLYKYSPQDLQMVLVDMKRVELKLYEGVPHLIAKVITDAEKAINALKWTVLEMDRRYRILEEYGKRNIRDYNKYAKEHNLESIAYLVFVIDELGDLMMLAKSEVEPIIVRLTQMSRAVGIHLVLGTQRPDTHVVTGLIKANVPSRIAFAVASQIDSRVILDQSGAEKLLGQGDGLFISPSNMHAIRFQGPNVEEDEVRKTVEFLRKQAEENDLHSNLNQAVTEPPKTRVNVPGMVSRDAGDGETDEVFEEAKRLVIQYQKASASFLQQMMGIGYPKAARIIQQLEEMGVVGPQNGSKPREVYEAAESNQ
jgi:S-DNA-T family DNA segregation ATPase FtsK/SpoIIIE